MNRNNPQNEDIVGIYCYKDTLDNNKIVYVGKDSNILHDKRHKQHYAPSNYNEQKINMILQDNPERYVYYILKLVDLTDNSFISLNTLEMMYISAFNPKFNFTKGGDGFSKGHTPWNKGKPHSKEVREKLSKNHWDCAKENNPNWKDYARIKKAGRATDKNKTQRYAISRNGKCIKRSIDIVYLKDWFKTNYPNEPLVCEVEL